MKFLILMHTMLPQRIWFGLLMLLICVAGTGCVDDKASSQAKRPETTMTDKNNTSKNSPQSACKLVFIHHSVGGHWLSHDYGNLVRELNKNNVYVNDITYGWEPRALTNNVFKKVKRKVLGYLKLDSSGAYSVGDRTDIGNMYDWFLGPDSNMIMREVYAENNETDRFGNHANNERLAALVADKENEILVFKSCYPNTLYKGSPDDKANTNASPLENYLAGSELHTVSNVKRTFNDALAYFKTRPDKFFVIVTPPPRLELPENGRIARGVANWLYYDWLKENKYPLNNVMVFDLYNVLTSGPGPNESDVDKEQGNHHRIWKGQEQHVVAIDKHVLVYPRKSGENHPSAAGLQKATKEFIPVLIERHHRWKQGISAVKGK